MWDPLTELDTLAPGVIGYTVEHAGALYIPMIEAEHAGSGAVGRYLDSLPRDRTVKVPTVISARLAGMLERRGFQEVAEWAPEVGEVVYVYVREAECNPT